MPAYDAFVSYSHAQDKPLAAALQSVVQKLGKPWYRRRALRIFRDDTSLAASPHLWPSIEQALGSSRYLILLASPQAAASPWVSKEVMYWLDHKRADTLLIAVTAGEIAWDEPAGDFRWSATTCLPPVLVGRFASEPRWVDLRPYAGGADLREPKFTELGADLAAIVHGTPKEDLLSQEVRQQKRALTLAWSAAGLLLLLVTLAGLGWKTAYEQTHVALEQRNEAESALKIAEQQRKIVQEQRDRLAVATGAASLIAVQIEIIMIEFLEARRDNKQPDVERLAADLRAMSKELLSVLQRPANPSAVGQKAKDR
jgi:hypothetical protein